MHYCNLEKNNLIMKILFNFFFFIGEGSHPVLFFLLISNFGYIVKWFVIKPTVLFRFGMEKTLKFPSERRLLFLQGLLAFQFWLDASKSLGRPWFTNLEWMHSITKFVKSAYDLFSLLNFVAFLRYGRFHSPMHRLVGACFHLYLF